MGHLFAEVRGAVTANRWLANLDYFYEPNSAPVEGVNLTQNSVAVGGQPQKLSQDLEGYGVEKGTAIQVVNLGRPSDAAYKPINVRQSPVNPNPDNVDPGLMVMTESGSVAVGRVKQIVVANGTLTYNAPGSVSISTGGGGGPQHGNAHFSLQLPATIIPPGPKNMTDATWHITAVNAAADGSVNFSASGISPTSFGESGSDADFTNRSELIYPGDRLSVSIGEPVGTANYLAVTWYYEEI